MMTQPQPIAAMHPCRAVRRRRSVRVSSSAALSAALAACGMMPGKDKHPDTVAPASAAAAHAAHRRRDLSGGAGNGVVRRSQSAPRGRCPDHRAERIDQCQQERHHQDHEVQRHGGYRARLFGKSITTKGVPILDTTLSGSNSFDGEGSSSQGNSLVGSLTVTVTNVQSQRQFGGARRQELEAQSGR